jgi:hypothetical protein
VGLETCLCKYVVVLRKETVSAVLLVSMCHTHACVNKIPVFWVYEMSPSISDVTGLPKHATLYVTYNTIGCTACLFETFPCLNSYKYRNGSQNVAQFFLCGKETETECILLI